MIDWLDVWGAITITTSLCTGWCTTDLLYVTPKIRRLAATADSMKYQVTASDPIDAVQRTFIEMQNQLDSANKRMSDYEDLQRKLSATNEKLSRLVSNGAATPNEIRKGVHDYRPRTDTYKWGGQVIRTMQDCYTAQSEWIDLATSTATPAKPTLLDFTDVTIHGIPDRVQETVSDVTTTYPDRSWIDFTTTPGMKSITQRAYDPGDDEITGM